MSNKGGKRTLSEDDIEVGDWLALTKERTGKVVWKGEVDYAEGTHFGVELAYGSLGKHNGTYKKKTYFTCAEGRGMIVKMDRIRKKLPGDPANMPAKTWKALGTSRLTASQENLTDDVAEGDEDRAFRKDKIIQMTALDVIKHLNKLGQASPFGGSELSGKEAFVREFFEKKSINGQKILTMTTKGDWVTLCTEFEEWCREEKKKKLKIRATKKKSRQVIQALLTDDLFTGVYEGDLEA